MVPAAAPEAGNEMVRSPRSGAAQYERCEAGKIEEIGFIAGRAELRP
jgi:hypothetical protein